MLEPADRTTEATVNRAPRATLRSACMCANSGQNTSVIPTMPSAAPSATRIVIAEPKKRRMPSMLRSGLAE